VKYLKIKIVGVLMAFIFCMTMVGGSFAATPGTNTAHELKPMLIIQSSLYHEVKAGKEVKVQAALCQDNGLRKTLYFRYLDFGIYDMDGKLITHEISITHGIHQLATVNINPDKWNLSPGHYKLKIKYDGDNTWPNYYAPCETGFTDFVVTQ
jgi:hypothetical protein